MSSVRGIHQHQHCTETKSWRVTFVTLPGTRTLLPQGPQPFEGEDNIIPIELADTEGWNYGTI